MRILNFGSLNIDYVYRVDSFVRPGETKACRSLRVNCGGKGLNQSIAAARAGCEVFHAGVAGADGGRLLDKLAEKGVDISLLTRSSGLSGNAIIEVDDAGQNRIILFGGTNRALTEEGIDRTLDAFGTEGLVLVQNETNFVDVILKKAHERGLQTAFNAAPMEEKVKEYPLGCVDYLLVNEVEGAALAGTRDEEQIVSVLTARYPELKLVLTLGEKGAVYAEGGKIWTIGSCKVPVADTTAAGDTFTGFFLYGMLSGQGPAMALKLATAASALCVQKPGAADSVPSLREVLEAMTTGGLAVPEAEEK